MFFIKIFNNKFSSTVCRIVRLIVDFAAALYVILTLILVILTALTYIDQHNKK